MNQQRILDQQTTDSQIWAIYSDVCEQLGIEIPEVEWSEVATWSVLADVMSGEKDVSEVRRPLRDALIAKFGAEAFSEPERLVTGKRGPDRGHHAEELARFRAWQIERDVAGLVEFRGLLGIEADDSGYIEPGEALNALIEVARRELGHEVELLVEPTEARRNGPQHFVDVSGLVRVPRHYLRIPTKGVLRDLMAFSADLAKNAAMTQPEALALVVGGVVPQYRHAEVSFRRSRIKSRYDRITLTLDPSLGSNDVKAIYAEARSQLNAHDRPASTSTLALLTYFRDPSKRNRSPESLLDTWNELARSSPGYPTFSSFPDMRRAVERAEGSLLDPAKTRKINNRKEESR